MIFSVHLPNNRRNISLPIPLDLKFRALNYSVQQLMRDAYRQKLFFHIQPVSDWVCMQKQ